MSYPLEHPYDLRKSCTKFQPQTLNLIPLPIVKFALCNFSLWADFEVTVLRHFFKLGQFEKKALSKVV